MSSGAPHIVAASVVATRLGALAPLSAEAIDLLVRLDGLQSHRAGTELWGERTPGNRPRFLVSGWAARVRWLSDGRRQIIGFVTAGDGLGLSARSPLAICPTIALTPVKTLDATPVVRALGSPEPPWQGLAEALSLAQARDEAMLLNQVVRLGRQTAYERMCHLLLEIRDRLALMGVGSDQTFPLPLTQETLADAMGLSIVHVNRMLQQLRSDKLIDSKSGQMKLLQPLQLESIADYRPLASPAFGGWERPSSPAGTSSPIG